MTMQESARKALSIIEDMDEKTSDFETMATDLLNTLMDVSVGQETSEHFQNARQGAECLVLFFIPEEYESEPLLLNITENLQKCVSSTEN